MNRALPLLATLVATMAACSAPANAPPLTEQPGVTPTPAPTTPVVAPTQTTDPTLPPLTGDAGVAPTGACAPAAAVTATPKAWKAPLGIRRNVCTPTDAANIVSCFMNKQNCTVPVSAACHQCAVSAETSAYAAALIINATGQVSELNVEGCVAGLTNDLTATGCGPKLAARFECAEQACTTCQDPAQRNSCLQAADTSACAAQNQAAACATPVLDQCIQGATQVDVAINLVKVFCGP